MATALWSSGVLAIRERSHFQRVYDLTERVIPERWRKTALAREDALEVLLLQAMRGHGWATTGTLTQTWRLRNMREAIQAALARLRDKGEIVACALRDDDGRRTPGWIRPRDLDLADRLKRVRPRNDRGVLLSPFDPVLWDRPRVRRLFGFDQVLEIFKPAPKRKYGYYCLPVLAGDGEEDDIHRNQNDYEGDQNHPFGKHRALLNDDNLFEDFQAVQRLAGSQGHSRQRIFGNCDGQSALLSKQLVEVFQ